MGCTSFLLKLLVCFWRFKNTSFTCINSDFWSKILGLIISYSYIGWEFEGKYIYARSEWLRADQRCMVHIEQRKQNPSKWASLHFLFFLWVGLCVYKWKNQCTSHSFCCCCCRALSILFFLEVWYLFHLEKKCFKKYYKPLPFISKLFYLLDLKDKFCFWASLPYKLNGKCCTSLLNFPLNIWVSVLLGIFLLLHYMF